ncbi:hypothetical protein E2562_012274 [Oryza meyeriana var. granulata]|uniref:Uncharacterized protein n=1 Tax=Oryza meyeriana var. granulata TaxID=110450 RepID=A0A6G1DH62_9ORYZ|nr:hypothetical protein E2562_012274 [Oryza meyeriana var. granulata]
MATSLDGLAGVDLQWLGLANSDMVMAPVARSSCSCWYVPPIRHLSTLWIWTPLSLPALDLARSSCRHH